MPEIPNLTDRIAELREHKKAASLRAHERTSPAPRPPRRERQLQTTRSRGNPAVQPAPGKFERKIASSPLVLSVYTLLFLGLAGQLVLITLLDLL